MKKLLTSIALFCLLTAPIFAQTNAPQLASSTLQDAVIAIIRHAEKPESGVELSPTGRERAHAYVNYFQNLALDSQPFKPAYLFATADSDKSHRPRLTLEPLSQAIGLPIDCRFKNKDFEKLAAEIRSRDHGKNILIAWHHGEIPQLLRALGADPAALLPDGKWPTDHFDWLLVLRFDHEGKLRPAQSHRLNEHLLPGDGDK